MDSLKWNDPNDNNNNNIYNNSDNMTTIIIMITITHDLYGISWWFDKLLRSCLFQSNETARSQQTELEGVKKFFCFFEAFWFVNWYFCVCAWIRENCVNTTHYFDIWVVARSQAKKLLALS